MNNSEEIIFLLKETLSLLKEIRGYLIEQMNERSSYTQSQDMRAFCINVAADIFVDMLAEDKDFRDKIKNSLKL